MPPEKKSTKGKKAKRDIFDFIKDATKKNSAVGMNFYNEANKKGVKAKDIYQLLIGWGYDVRLEDVTKMWKLYETNPIVKKYAIESAERQSSCAFLRHMTNLVGLLGNATRDFTGNRPRGSETGANRTL